jgi:NADH-quinone oxidoreductase subunit M
VTTAVIFVPLLGAAIVLALPRRSERLIKAVGLAAAAADLVVVVAMWVLFDPSGGLQFVEDVTWIPTVDIGYRVGVDGLSLPLVGMTALIVLACLVFSWTLEDRVKEYVALFLALGTVSIGVFAALDLILFFVFWDLSLVFMYLIVIMWGHEGRERAGLKFFLYTFFGSLALLLGIIGLFVAGEPHTFDMVALTRQPPLSDQPVLGGLILLALAIGFAVKTPLVPVHTWLPPAHVTANAPGSAILAGVLLKMGTYGFVRIAMSMLPDAWRRWAIAFVVLGVVSGIYGALVALGQSSFKRLVAYSSINHMGYVLLGLGAAGFVASASEEALELAVAGAITLMVTHGIISAMLFLLSGVLYRRAGHYEMDEFGGLARYAPAFAVTTAIAAFAALGLPGLAQFVAELQVFVGALEVTITGVALSLVAVLITAGFFLWAVHRIFLGRPNERWAAMPDLAVHEHAAIQPLVLLTLVIGIFPRWLLDVIEPAASTVVSLLSGP